MNKEDFEYFMRELTMLADQNEYIIKEALRQRERLRHTMFEIKEREEKKHINMEVL